MVFPIYIKLDEDPPFEGSKRALNEIHRAAHLAIGSHWYRFFLPRHFTREARAKYHHQPRTPGYQKRKERLAARGKARYGGQVDNVLTGLSETVIRSSAAIKPYPTRVTVELPSPDYFSMRPYKSGQPNKGQEVANISPDEVEALMDVGQQELERGLNAYREKKTTHFRG